MTREEILENIKMLAKSQGFYGRILRAIEEDDSILDTLEEQNFKDVIDLVLYLESWGYIMFYYPTVLDNEKMTTTIKYTLQDKLFRGSFTLDITSQAKGGLLFDTEILTTLDTYDIENINRTSKDLRLRLEDEDIIVQFLNENGDVVHTVDELNEYYNTGIEEIVVGIEVINAVKSKQ